MIILHKSKDKQFYFTAVGRNGKVIATSETYTRRSNAIDGIWALRKALMKGTLRDKTK